MIIYWNIFGASVKRFSKLQSIVEFAKSYASLQFVLFQYYPGYKKLIGKGSKSKTVQVNRVKKSYIFEKCTSNEVTFRTGR